ncbi:carboxylesterase [Aspergillus clavatus NRRL 1]|uniref:Carboxylic ester hydrolase n=1 Tax=Aspergillus clavatus (strain ATCC 1007 / CBS 513.65 / DSM 816 / NCTC 3887 / NRRL 1 / QM 1276 / 107) TaxID=344612 RepID=A1CLH7_ASPCL|nr:carboxylesterase [Aspergillus clavatus NRRL 1]EAW10001.1 carboxylesterase [Aspergillus clavatus NRRL 1]
MNHFRLGFWQTLLVLVTVVNAQLLSDSHSRPYNPVGQSVQTSSGLVRGHAASEPTVSEYLGIPYAVSPTGIGRFAPPVPYNGTGTILANGYPPGLRILSNLCRDCPANIASLPAYPGLTRQGATIFKTFAQQLGTPQSEDCLYLNVWTKPTQKLKPVLVFIHGGRFSVGGAHSPMYTGEHLAAKNDVVVVTFNYRLNIFGFSGAPGLPQNVGLLDQRMAIEWVHSNIAAFGGDPGRITIFGQSAGGASVDYYSYIWTDKPLVRGLISHSGTALSFRPNTAEESASYFYYVAGTLGCGNSTDPVDQVVACLRQQPVAAVLSAVKKVPFAPSPALPQPQFHPTVDGVTVFDNYAERSAQGKFIKTPYLITSNNNEAGYYRINAFAGGIDLTDEAWNRFNQAAFTCPSSRAAADRAAHGVSTWQARYFGDFWNLRLYPTSGAYHGTDLHMVFGTAEEITGIPDSEVERKTNAYISSAWVEFAKDPERGLEKLGWPKYKPTGEGLVAFVVDEGMLTRIGKTLVGLGYKNESKARILDQKVYDAGCAALNGDTTPGKGAF